MKSIVVCVEYDDFLEITLPRNRCHFDRTLVVTSSADVSTQTIAKDNGCELFITDVFYDRGASFNKGAAIEKGFDILGRDGWICIWDPDIIMPKEMEFHLTDTLCLYGALRRTLDDPLLFHDDLDWETVRVTGLSDEFPGYFQVFHTDGVKKRPWYSIDWKHAGGCDSDFQDKFRKEDLRRLPFHVMHLGPTIEEVENDRIGKNWFGRVSPRIDGKPIPDVFLVKRKEDYSNAIESRRKYGIQYEKL